MWFVPIFLKIFVIFVVFYEKIVYNLLMNVKMDLHTHTLASGHYTTDTLTDLAKRAKERGLTHLGITDHAPKMPGSANVNYFRNLRYCDRWVHGVRILYGVELNALDQTGTVDLDESVLCHLDYALVSLHKQTYKPQDMRLNTLALTSAMENKFVVGVCHPDDPTYEIDVKTLVEKAKQTGTMLELSSVSVSPDGYREKCVERLVEMLLLCKQKGVYVMLGSDSHGIGKIGDFANSLKLLKALDFPQELVVNFNPEKFFEIVKNKRK